MGTVPLDFEGFCHESYVPLIRTLTLYCGDPEVARDLAQEALARTYASWRRVRQMAYPRLWLNRVAINLANSRFRRLKAEHRALEMERTRSGRFHVDPDPAMAVVIRRALATLSPRQRAAVILRFFDDLSVEETAELMNCGPGTVKKLTKRALDGLREQLGSEFRVEVSDGA